jgi:hypothetical protein
MDDQDEVEVENATIWEPVDQADNPKHKLDDQDELEVED